jgi:NADH-quinone oxidoreductase subunit G
VGAWDGARVAGTVTKAEGAAEGLVLASWKQMIDDGRMQDGDPKLRETARKPVVLVGAATLNDLGVAEGDVVKVSGDNGSIELPVALAADMAPGTVWAPASAPGASVRHLVGPAGSRVRIAEGGKA